MTYPLKLYQIAI
uniref:Uncharacterized protein n=1 Tax=Lepeophtheirus salmonis TaxID=72036 RepID=A0A0K2TX49_LEPSM